MKLALVTGGCRRLGAAIAAALAERGYALALHASHDPEPDKALAASLDRAGADWHGFAADLADADQTERLVDEVAAHFGAPPALLVNSAAMFEEDRPESVTYRSMLDHYAVNAAAPAILARRLAALRTEPGGAIVNLLDQRLAAPHGDQISYTLSKFALAGLTAILARELAPGFRVNAVAPGLTIPTGDYAVEQLESLAGRMPLERLPQPQEIALAVVWLAEAGAVTGQTIFVDAGAHLERFRRDFLYL